MSATLKAQGIALGRYRYRTLMREAGLRARWGRKFIQYASAQHQALLGRHGFICSMSRRGNCWDNAVMERFFLNLKMERVWQRTYANHIEAMQDVADYIVNFYNQERLHSTLGYRSPAQFEQLTNQTVQEDTAIIQ